MNKEALPKFSKWSATIRSLRRKMRLLPSEKVDGEQRKDKGMKARATDRFSTPVSAQVVPITSVHSNRRRRITSEAGHALETLSHALEYLTDEYMRKGRTFSAKDEQLEAVQILMALNRQVYFECPEVPTFVERWRALLHFHSK
jgi:hypothetical protein